jgi:hypothetical protein
MGRNGAAQLAASDELSGTYRVYNLGVETEHTYEVSPLELLVHNTCITENSPAGRAREANTEAALKEQYRGTQGATVQREQYLRNADGTIAKDPVSGEARRIDHVVIENGTALRSVETTSKAADKSAQINKELRIREGGGTFIRDRTTRQLVDLSSVPTDLRRID